MNTTTLLARLKSTYKKHYVFTFIVLISLAGIIVFSPLIFFSKLATSHSYQENITFTLQSVTFTKWLLVGIFCTFPLWAEVFFDGFQFIRMDRSENTSNVKTNEFVAWCARVLLLIIITLPNFVLYMLGVVKHERITLFYIIFLQQQTFLICVGILCSMFGHKFVSCVDRNDKLDIEIENKAIWFLLCEITSHTVFAAAIITNSHKIFLLSRFVTLLCIIYGLYVGGKIFLFLRRQMVNFTFRSAEQMSDYYHIILCIAFIILSMVFALTLNSYDSNSKCSNFINNTKFPYFSIYLQIGLISCLVMIPSRTHFLSAALKQEKLATRLNLIRYVSHELRTPLNTSFLGMNYLKDDIEKVRKQISMISTKLNSNNIEIQDNFKTNNNSNSNRHQSIKVNINNFNSSNLFLGLFMNPTNSNDIENNVITNENIMKINTMDEVIQLNQLSEWLDTTEQVHNSCNIALETLNDLLTFDKLEESKLMIEVEKLDCWKFVQDVAKPFAINASVSNINFHLTLVDEVTKWNQSLILKADKFKLGQVLRNLVSNALKFTPSGGSVDVLVEKINRNSENPTCLFDNHDEFENCVRFSVRDTGHGISKENQKKLFGQYVQFNAAALQKGGGSGLGLWISKNIIELHGGHIGGVSNGEGLGSTFFIDLPLFDADASSFVRKINVIRKKNRFLNHEINFLNKNVSEEGHDSLKSDFEKANIEVRDTTITSRIMNNDNLEANVSHMMIENHNPSNVPVDDDNINQRQRNSSIHPTASQKTISSFFIKSNNKVSPLLNNYNQEEKRNSISSTGIPIELNIIENRCKSYWSSGLKIMIVDDSPLNLKVTRRLLSSFGHQVEESCNGNDLLIKIKIKCEELLSIDNNIDDNNNKIHSKYNKDHLYDIILIDDNMPILSGPETVQILRSNGYNGVIVGLTGNGYSEQIETFKQSGVDEVFVKPLNIEQLKIFIENKIKY
eukprot:gene5789-7987_t